MDNATRDEIIVQQLQTPKGKELFAAAFFRGVNRALKVPDTEGDPIIQEFQEKYGTLRVLTVDPEVTQTYSIIFNLTRVLVRSRIPASGHKSIKW